MNGKLSKIEAFFQTKGKPNQAALFLLRPSLPPGIFYSRRCLDTKCPNPPQKQCKIPDYERKFLHRRIYCDIIAKWLIEIIRSKAAGLPGVLVYSLNVRVEMISVFWWRTLEGRMERFPAFSMEETVQKEKECFNWQNML